MWCQNFPNRSVTALGVPEVAGVLDNHRVTTTWTIQSHGLLQCCQPRIGSQPLMDIRYLRRERTGFRGGQKFAISLERGPTARRVDENRSIYTDGTNYPLGMAALLFNHSCVTVQGTATARSVARPLHCHLDGIQYLYYSVVDLRLPDVHHAPCEEDDFGLFGRPNFLDPNFRTRLITNGQAVGQGTGHRTRGEP